FVSGCAAPEVGRAGKSEKSIVGGTDDSGDPGVVLVWLRFASDAICTAEVISPHVILSAAHCIQTPNLAMSTMSSIYLGNNARDGGTGVLIPVSEMHMHPKWDSSNVKAGSDLAVLIVKDPLSITPLPLNRTPITDDFLTGPTRIVGYGITSSPDSDQ